MAQTITTISIPQKIKEKAQEASKEIFGEVNLSGYIKVLVDIDCQKRGIK